MVALQFRPCLPIRWRVPAFLITYRIRLSVMALSRLDFIHEKDFAPCPATRCFLSAVWQSLIPGCSCGVGFGGRAPEGIASEYGTSTWVVMSST